MTQLLSPKQFAAEVGLSKQRIIQLIHAGKIKANRVGNAFSISQRELKKFMIGKPKEIETP